MDREQIEAKLKDSIHDVLSYAQDIDMEASIIKDYGVNSISLIRILVALENKFNISFSDYELALSCYDSFGDIVATVEEKLA